MLTWIPLLEVISMMEIIHFLKNNNNNNNNFDSTQNVYF